MSEPLLEAIVIHLNERAKKDYRKLLNIICAEAKKKERTSQDIIVRDILPGELVPNIIVGVYESPHKTRSITPRDARGRKTR
jgi:hypothetical protein